MAFAVPINDVGWELRFTRPELVPFLSFHIRNRIDESDVVKYYFLQKSLLTCTNLVVISPVMPKKQPRIYVQVRDADSRLATRSATISGIKPQLAMSLILEALHKKLEAKK